MLDDGTMLAINYIKEQNAIAFSVVETDGEIEDIAVLDDDNYDELYLVVKKKR